MKKLKTFFVTFFRSFTDPAYYNDVVKANSGFSFKYFILFYVFFSVISVAIMSLTTFKSFPGEIDKGLDSLVNMYPADLEVSFDTVNAEVSTKGMPEPIIIPIGDNDGAPEDLKNFLVIDTSVGPDKITDYQTAVLLTKQHLVTLKESGSGYQTFALKDFAEGLKDDKSGHAITNLTLNKSFIENNVPLVKKAARTFLKFVPVIMWLMMTISYVVSRLFILLFLTIANLLTNAVTGRGLSYGKLFQIGLHTITITDAITGIQHLIFAYYVPYLFTFAFLGISLIAMLGIKPNQPTKQIA